MYDVIDISTPRVMLSNMKHGRYNTKSYMFSVFILWL